MSDRVGPYQLIKLIGSGGMGEVWSARDTRNARKVAIKLLAGHALSDPELQERFRRECELAGQIWHPHILPVWDFLVDGRPYIVMPLVEDGTDLSTILNSNPIKPERAVNIVRQVASALDAAHRAGLRHRDVKPSNIMVRRDGDEEQVLLFDWGIAQPVDTSGAPPVTRADHLVGTPAYIAPERLSDNVTADHRADVYSLAVVLYECLAGRKPFEGEDMAVLTAQVLRDPPPLPDHLPSALRDVVAKGLAKDPDDRWQSAGELATAAYKAVESALAAPQPATSATLRVGRLQPVNKANNKANAATNAPRIVGTGLAGAVATLLLLLAGVVDLTTFWILLPLLAGGGALVGFGIWGARRPANPAVRPGDPTMDAGTDAGRFPKLGP